MHSKVIACLVVALWAVGCSTARPGLSKPIAYRQRDNMASGRQSPIRPASVASDESVIYRRNGPSNDKPVNAAPIRKEEAPSPHRGDAVPHPRNQTPPRQEPVSEQSRAIQPKPRPVSPAPSLENKDRADKYRLLFESGFITKEEYERLPAKADSK